MVSQVRSSPLRSISLVHLSLLTSRLSLPDPTQPTSTPTTSSKKVAPPPPPSSSRKFGGGGSAKPPSLVAKWERRKRPSDAFAPTLRSGCTMALWVAKNTAVMFGGVTDEDRHEETLESVFWNDMCVLILLLLDSRIVPIARYRRLRHLSLSLFPAPRVLSSPSSSNTDLSPLRLIQVRLPTHRQRKMGQFGAQTTEESRWWEGEEEAATAEERRAG